MHQRMPVDHFDFFRVDLNLLVAFDALYVERHVSRAAARVGVTQPAMSHSLARLRALFADELFLRRAAGVAPRVRQVLDGAHALLTDGSVFEPARSRRIFRLALSDAQQAVMLPGLLSRLHAAAPEAGLQALPFERTRVRAQLAGGELDLAISRFDEPGEDFRATALCEERHVALYHPEQLRLDGPLDLRQYLAHPHVLLSFGGDRSGVADEALARAGHRRRVLATTPHAHVVGMLLARTPAIALLPSRIARPVAGWFGLVVTEPPLDLAPWTLAALRHRRSDGDAGLRWLEGLLVAGD
ncbi:MAG: LysR family transcriptional regulator [Rubrivivax sp.]